MIRINNDELFKINIPTIWGALNEKQRNNLANLANNWARFWLCIVCYPITLFIDTFWEFNIIFDFKDLKKYFKYGSSFFERLKQKQIFIFQYWNCHKIAFKLLKLINKLNKKSFKLILTWSYLIVLPSFLIFHLIQFVFVFASERLHSHLWQRFFQGFFASFIYGLILKAQPANPKYKINPTSTS